MQGEKELLARRAASLTFRQGRWGHRPLRTGTKPHTVSHSPVGPATLESGRLIAARRPA